MTNSTEPQSLIGKTGNLVVSNPDPRRDVGELRVRVKITDARSAYGRTDVEVTPVKGSGRLWVSLHKLEGVK